MNNKKCEWYVILVDCDLNVIKKPMVIGSKDYDTDYAPYNFLSVMNNNSIDIEEYILENTSPLTRVNFFLSIHPQQQIGFSIITEVNYDEHVLYHNEDWSTLYTTSIDRLLNFIRLRSTVINPSHKKGHLHIGKNTGDKDIALYQTCSTIDYQIRKHDTL